MAEDRKNIKNSHSEEIDLVEVIQLMWEKRSVIFKTIAAFFVLGLFIIFLSPKEYKSEVTLLVETASSNAGVSGLLQQFGGFAGLGNLGSMEDNALTPELYPDIIKSTPFLLKVLNARLTDEKHDTTLTTYAFLDRYTRMGLGEVIISYTIGLPYKIIGLFRGKSKEPDTITTNVKEEGPVRLSAKLSDIAHDLSQRIEAKEGESPNILLVSVEMQDPLLAAQLTDTVVKNLTAYIIDYRTQKAKHDLEFVYGSYLEAEKRLHQAQRALASFKDRNMNVISASAQITEQNLQSDYTLAFNLYNTLAQQLEQAKLKVQEKTPVFKVVEPAKVPLGRFSPKAGIILITMFFLGGFLGFGIVLGKLLFVKKL